MDMIPMLEGIFYPLIESKDRRIEKSKSSRFHNIKVGGLLVICMLRLLCGSCVFIQSLAR